MKGDWLTGESPPKNIGELATKRRLKNLKFGQESDKKANLKCSYCRGI